MGGKKEVKQKLGDSEGEELKPKTGGAAEGGQSGGDTCWGLVGDEVGLGLGPRCFH